MRKTRPTLTRLVALSALLALTACQTQRSVTVSGGLASLPGAKHNYGENVKIKGRQGTTIDQALAQHAPVAGEELEEVENEPLRLTDEDGNITLISRSPRHVLFHLTRTLDKGEHDILFEQVIAEETKRDYRLADRDPRDALEFILKHESEIRELVRTMPMGEQTPGLLLKPLGPNRFRLRAPPTVAADMRFTQADFVVEDGRFRLLVIR